MFFFLDDDDEDDIENCAKMYVFVCIPRISLDKGLYDDDDDNDLMTIMTFVLWKLYVCVRYPIFSPLPLSSSISNQIIMIMIRNIIKL